MLGRLLDVNGTRRRVVGIMGADFVPPLMTRAQLFIPLDLRRVLADGERSHKFRFLQAIARVRPGTSNRALQDDLNAVLASLARERPDAYAGLGLEPVTLREEMTGTIRACSRRVRLTPSRLPVSANWR